MIWQSLHAELESVGRRHPVDDDENSLSLLRDSANQTLLQSLQQFPAANWYLIGEGAGWTSCSAAAYSWCQGALLSSVLDSWRKIDTFDFADETNILAAKILNPRLLPPAKLSAIVEAGEDLVGQWVLTIALRVHTREIQQDMTQDDFAQVHPFIKSLVSRHKTGQVLLPV